MTVAVKVKVEASQPRGAEFKVEHQLGSGKDAFWQAGEVGTISPGEEREFVLYPGHRVVLEE